MIGCKLGEIYKDPITGFRGTAIARAKWLYGCDRIALQATLDNDGKVPEPQWFDELQLQKIKPEEAKKTGGPQKDPKKGNKDPL